MLSVFPFKIQDSATCNLISKMHKILIFFFIYLKRHHQLYVKISEKRQTKTNNNNGNRFKLCSEYNKLTDAEVYQLRRCNLIFF